MEIKTEFQIYFQRRRKLYINFPIHDCKIFKALYKKKDVKYI